MKIELSDDNKKTLELALQAYYWFVKQSKGKYWEKELGYIKEAQKLLFIK